MTKNKLYYKLAGVDINAWNEAVDVIKRLKFQAAMLNRNRWAKNKQQKLNELNRRIKEYEEKKIK